MAIKQTLSLEGLAQATDGLKKLGETGESAFSRISGAIEGGSSSLESLVFNLLRVGGALTTLTGAVTTFAAITGSLVGITVSASRAGEEFENLGVALGTSTENASALVSSFARAGADVDGLAIQLKRAATNITNEWARIQESVRQASLKSQQDILSIQQAQNNLAKSTIAASFADKNAALQRTANIQSLSDAQTRLDDLLRKQEERKTGIPEDPFDKQERELAAEQDAIDKATLQRDQAKQKAAQDAAEAQSKAAQQEIELRLQNLALAKAEQQADEDRKNSVANLAGFVDDLTQGVTSSSHDINRTVENIFTGIVASAGGLHANLTELKGDFASVASPTVIDVLLKTSDVMKNLTSNIERQALASKILGRQVGQEEVSFFAQGREAVLKYLEAVQELHLEFTTKDAEATLEFRKNLFTLEDTLSRIKDKIGVVFAPVFGPFFETLANLLAENKNRFVALAQTLSDTVKPTLDSVIRVLSGEATPDDKWLLDLIEGFEKFGRTLTDIVVPALISVFDVIGFVADQINSAFGTQLNAASLLFIAWGLKILGVFRAVSVGLGLLGAALAVFGIEGAASIAPLLLAFIAISAAAVGLLALLDKKSREELTKLGSQLVDLGKTIADNFKNAGGSAGINNATSGLQSLIDKLDDADADAKDLGTSTASSFDRARTSIDAATSSTNKFAQAQKTATSTNKFVTPGQAPGAGFVSPGDQLNKGFVTPGGSGTDKQQGTPTQQVQATTQEITQSANESAQGAVDAFTKAAQRIADIWQDMGQDLGNIDIVTPFETAETDVEQVFQSIAQSAEDMSRRVQQAAQQAAQALEQLNSSAPATFDQRFGGFASGGHVWGPGSETSDSIFAFLSRNEFVQPANRVRQYGIGFMEAIRHGLLSTDAVRMLMGDFRGFRYGGLAGVPRFADGGAVSSGGGGTRILQLVLGGQTFEVSGHTKVIDALEREASIRSMASAGIAQSFVGRR